MRLITTQGAVVTPSRPEGTMRAAPHATARTGPTRHVIPAPGVASPPPGDVG